MVDPMYSNDFLPVSVFFFVKNNCFLKVWYSTGKFGLLVLNYAFS